MGKSSRKSRRGKLNSFGFVLCRNTKKMIIKFEADPNHVIEGHSIAAIHFAAGMENTDFAEWAMKLILKNKGEAIRCWME